MNNVYNILKFLTDFHEDGIAKVITSDQGTVFNNKLDHELMKLLSIEH